MSITGGLKLFNRSMCLYEDGTTIVASSGDAAGPRCLDRNPISYWRSVGSSDVTTEELEITFTEAKTFDRIFLIDHNFESFNIQYFDGATYQHFANVTDIDGSQSNITETTYSRDTSYFEFTEVTSTKIRIQVTTTQVADDQKYLNQVIVTSEMGTLQGYPQIKGLELSRNLRTEKMLSGRSLTFKSDEFFKVQLDFKDYPPSLSADIDLIFSLHDIEDTFLIWICGGKTGSSYFRKQMRGYRLRDVISVQLTASIKPIYSDNVFVNAVNFSAQLQEAVG